MLHLQTASRVSIDASNSISSGAGAIYHAPTLVLKPGFTALSGSSVHIYPIGCSNTFVARKAKSTSNTSFDDSDIEFKTGKIIKIYPNPSDGVFKISINEVKEGTIVVTDLYGRTIYKSAFKDQNEFEMNLQDKSKGIYIVKVVSGNKTDVEKIIKN